MAQPAVLTYRRVAALAVAGMLLAGMLPGGATARASAEDASVTGRATGYWAELSLFGGPPTERGPEPVVELEPDASDSPQEATVQDVSAVYGPAVLFRAAQVDVRVEGTTGPGASVTSTSRAEADLDAEPGEPETRPGPMLYDTLESTCTADEDGFTVTTAVTNGEVETSYDADTGEVLTSEPVPDNPEPGYTVEGTIDHVGDRFRIVYNEQTVNDDGTVTVNAAHLYLLGDIAVGDLIVGQTTCGTAATPAAELPIENTDTTPDPGEADETADEEDPVGDEDADDAVPDAEDEAAPPADADNGTPVGMVALGVGALLVLGIVVALVLGRRGKSPADGADG